MARTATATGATRIIEEPANSVDVYFGSRDGAGMRRVDVEIKPAPNGGLEVGISVPSELRAVVLALAGC